MGNSASMSDQFSDSMKGLEKRLGKIPITGRYHTLPKRVEDDYTKLDKVLGSGFNGQVHLATSKSGDSAQKYAVKEFRLINVPTDQRELLKDEVEVFLSMDHPHITRLFDVYESKESLQLIMECMDGGELFDRVIDRKTFSERDAADATWQMLLALNYIHSHGIVHRDIKLENFLYDRKGSDHLKLIDFGFSKLWAPNTKMQASCGTLSYVAPEVLQKNYTSQCDLWSLGIVSFILLVGYMPFSGSDEKQMRNIKAGNYSWKQEKWNKVSPHGVDFIKSLLEVNPQKRLSAQKALEHVWIKDREAQPNVAVEKDVIDALRQFGSASKFRRCCMEMMAWSLSNEERAQVRQYFISMDKTQQGTITLGELKTVLEDKFHIPDDETRAIFEALDSNEDHEIHYSDFLAAMVSHRIALHDQLLRSTFKKFDTDNSGYITKENLRQVLGDTFDGEQVDKLMVEADTLKDGQISYPEFVSYIRGTPMDHHPEATGQIIDVQLKPQPVDKKSGKKSLLRPSQGPREESSPPSRTVSSCIIC